MRGGAAVAEFESKMRERRKASRQPLNAEIWADPGGTGLPVPCQVHDISARGARLSVASGIELPDGFFLKIAGETHRAVVVWRRGVHRPRVGVRFETLPI